MDFHIGQLVVCVDSKKSSRLKEGLTYTVLNIDCCVCVIPQLGINVFVPKGAAGWNNICTCGDEVITTNGLFHARRFRPLDAISDYKEFTEKITQPLEEVNYEPELA